MKKNIAIIKGGNSAEKGVSLKSAEVVEKNLSQEKFNLFPILIDGKDWTYTDATGTYTIDKNDFSLQISNSKIQFDLAFIAIHGTPGEDGKLQAYFDMLNIAYTTSSSFACALSFNKALTNSYLSGLGVKCGKAVYLTENSRLSPEVIIEKIGLPCFVKPNEAGSSFGVSKVNTAKELLPAINHAFEHDKKVIVEEFLEGIEVTCGVHDLFGTTETLPITEIVSENDFFDYAAKYEGKSQEITPARISDKDAKTVELATLNIYTLLELKGVARVDYILRDGIPYIIEANTVPGLSEESLIPQQVREKGIQLDVFFNGWAERFLKSDS